MNQRTKTKLLVTVGAMISFMSANLPPELMSVWWFKFSIAVLNVGILTYLGMRQPGVKNGNP